MGVRWILAVGLDEGVSAAQAQDDAVANCSRAGGTECDIQAWSCTNR